MRVGCLFCYCYFKITLKMQMWDIKRRIWHIRYKNRENANVNIKM